MRLKLMIVAALTAGALSLSANAQEWKLVALDSGRLTFADSARIERNEVAASVWALESFPAVRYIGDNRYPHRSRTLRYVFNCIEGTYTIAERMMHAGTLGHGRPVWSGRAEVPAFLQVDAGGPAAALQAAACGTGALAQSKVATPLVN